MTLLKQIYVCWTLPITPVYDHLYERISQPLMLPTGIVVLDGADLVKIDFQGRLIWRFTHDYGFWGSPMQLKSGLIVCATLDNEVYVINQAGECVQVIALPTSVSTEILVGDSDNFWLGMGGLECAVTRIHPRCGIVYKKYIARDSGVHHPLSQTADGSLWIVANSNLIRLNPQTGQILAQLKNDQLFCLSAALPCPDGVLVVMALPDNSSAIVKVAHDGRLLSQYPFPTVQRARLLANPEGGAWLVGSTVSPWEPATASDKILVARLAPDGKPQAISQTCARRAIQATVDSNGALWMGTYSYEDDGESGELTVYEAAAVPIARWTPDSPAGVGAPIFNPNGSAVIATSTALVGIQMLDSTSSTLDPLSERAINGQNPHSLQIHAKSNGHLLAYGQQALVG